MKETKKCHKCKETKPIDDFIKQNGTLSNKCWECRHKRTDEEVRLQEIQLMIDQLDSDRNNSLIDIEEYYRQRSLLIIKKENLINRRRRLFLQRRRRYSELNDE